MLGKEEFFITKIRAFGFKQLGRSLKFLPGVLKRRVVREGRGRGWVARAEPEYAVGFKLGLHLAQADLVVAQVLFLFAEQIKVVVPAPAFPGQPNGFMLET